MARGDNSIHILNRHCCLLLHLVQKGETLKATFSKGLLGHKGNAKGRGKNPTHKKIKQPKARLVKSQGHFVQFLEYILNMNLYTVKDDNTALNKDPFSLRQHIK